MSACLMCTGFPSAMAATATFLVAPNGNISSIAGAADGAGVTVGQGESIGIVFDQTYARFAANGFTPVDPNINIFASTAGPGGAVAALSFGQFDETTGSTTIFHTQNFSSNSGSVNLNFLAFTGCGAAGGCNFIGVETINTFNGSAGFTLDAISLDSGFINIVTVAATPEPSSWALMIFGFAAVGWRLKERKKNALAHTSEAGSANLQFA